MTDSKPWSITDAYAAMQTNEARNRQIVSEILEASQSGRTPLVLTERYEHAKLLANLLRGSRENVFLLSGKGSAKEKRELLDQLSQIPSEEPLILVATGQYVGEGFDLPRLDTLFLAMPISWKGTLAQYAGRLHRYYEGKQEVLIYDYVDFRAPMLERMYHKRLSGYASIGYTIRGSKTAPAADDRIFTQEDYWPAFAQDIQNAQKKIQIVVPYLHTAQVKRFLVRIPEDVHVSVITADESSFKPETWLKMRTAIELLQTDGVHVQFLPKVHQRYAVIDEHLIWYGGINYLGFEKAAQGAMRLSSQELAKELTAANPNSEQP